jgi:hypothetical protein
MRKTQKSCRVQDLMRWGGGSSFVVIEKSASAKSARDPEMIAYA